MENPNVFAEQYARDAHTELALIVAGKKPYLTPDQWRPVEYAARAPLNGVTLDGGPVKECFERNIAYLNDWFAQTKGGRVVKNEKNWWETVLCASSEGRMIGGAAHALRWGERDDMRQIVDTIVGIVRDRQRVDGYCLPYPEAEMAPNLDVCRDERRNYDRVNLTRGLIAASLAGNPDALPILRRFYDWLNASPYVAGLLAGPYDGTADKVNVVATTPGAGTAHNCNNGHEGHLLMYFSAMGKPEDLVAAERYFVQDFFLDASARREPLSLSHYPFHIAHSYVLLAYKAWLDHYRATGAAKYLEAAKGAWQIVHDHFLHVGGSLAICEHVCGSYPPGSYYLHHSEEHHTGENCGSVFWADINHRLLQFFPTETKYADQIEQVIFNATLANQNPDGRIRYHSRLDQAKGNALSVNTCCEVMGSPFIASLPQYIYSVAGDGVYVNLFVPSSITCPAGAIKMVTDFPFSGKVAIETSTKVHIRIPGWVTQDVPVRLSGAVVAIGKAGTYVTVEGPGAIDFELPMEFRTVRYTGQDQHALHPRCALLYGPVLMALTGVNDLNVPSAELPGRLKPVAGKPLFFKAPGGQYRPYWMIDQEPMTCFPTMR
jgi:DUF1680 family protein